MDLNRYEYPTRGLIHISKLEGIIDLLKTESEENRIKNQLQTILQDHLLSTSLINEELDVVGDFLRHLLFANSDLLEINYINNCLTLINKKLPSRWNIPKFEIDEGFREALRTLVFEKPSFKDYKLVEEFLMSTKQSNYVNKNKIKQFLTEKIYEATPISILEIFEIYNEILRMLFVENRYNYELQEKFTPILSYFHNFFEQTLRSLKISNLAWVCLNILYIRSLIISGLNSLPKIEQRIKILYDLQKTFEEKTKDQLRFMIKMIELKTVDSLLINNIGVDILSDFLNRTLETFQGTYSLNRALSIIHSSLLESKVHIRFLDIIMQGIFSFIRLIDKLLSSQAVTEILNRWNEVLNLLVDFNIKLSRTYVSQNFEIDISDPNFINELSRRIKFQSIFVNYLRRIYLDSLFLIRQPKFFDPDLFSNILELIEIQSSEVKSSFELILQIFLNQYPFEEHFKLILNSQNFDEQFESLILFPLTRMLYLVDIDNFGDLIPDYLIGYFEISEIILKFLVNWFSFLYKFEKHKADSILILGPIVVYFHTYVIQFNFTRNQQNKAIPYMINLTYIEYLINKGSSDFHLSKEFKPNKFLRFNIDKLPALEKLLHSELYTEQSKIRTKLFKHILDPLKGSWTFSSSVSKDYYNQMIHFEGMVMEENEKEEFSDTTAIKKYLGELSIQIGMLFWNLETGKIDKAEPLPPLVDIVKFQSIGLIGYATHPYFWQDDNFALPIIRYVDPIISMIQMYPLMVSLPLSFIDETKEI